MGKTYQFRTTFTFDGKRYAVYADTEKELWQKKASKLRDLEEGRIVVGPDMLFKDWAKLALDTYKRNVSESTLQAMELRIRKHILSQIGNMPIRSIRPMHCQNILNLQEGMSFSHVKKLSQELSFLFRKAVENQIILNNPAENVILPKYTKGSRRSLTDYEEQHFLAVCEKDSGFTIFLLMYYCGCRPAEAIRAIGKDLTMENGSAQLHIRGTKTENADRSVPVPAVLYKRLANTSPFDPIAPNREGRAHTEASYDRAVSSLKRAMNISMGCRVYRNQLLPPFPLASDFVPYCLRHTYCTNLAKSGVDVRTAQKLMGHASIQMTADIYTHVDQSQILAAGEKLDAFYAAR